MSESQHTLIQEAPLQVEEPKKEEKPEESAEAGDFDGDVTAVQGGMPEGPSADAAVEPEEPAPVESASSSVGPDDVTKPSAPVKIPPVETPAPEAAPPVAESDGKSSSGARTVGFVVVVLGVVGAAGYFWMNQGGEGLSGVASVTEKAKPTEVAKVEQPEAVQKDVAPAKNTPTAAATKKKSVTEKKETFTPAPVKKITKPKLSASQFTPLAVAGLEDEELKYVLTSGDYKPKHLRLAVIVASRKKTDDFTDLLAKMVENGDYFVRVEVLKALSREPHASREKSINAVLSRLSDKEYLVRGFAAKLLGNMASPASESALEKQLGLEENKTVKKVLEVSLIQVREALAINTE